MSSPEYCLEEGRREKVRAAKLNGLDYLEVKDETQQVLRIYFLGKAPPPVEVAGKPPRRPITERNVRIEGGRRVRDIRVKSVSIFRDPNKRVDDWLEVTVDKVGDFSSYILRLVNDPKLPGDNLLAQFDARYTWLEFSFKQGCPSDLDCGAAEECPPPVRAEPEINYLAKDYGSFRQLILDRLALTMPAWQERHVPDLGIALVEVLAYVGDYLSYFQDAVATEAYLGTARQRISVRRHARLVDYQLHEGCNARAWLFVWLGGTDELSLPVEQVAFITAPPGADEAATMDADEVQKLPRGDYEWYEPLTGSTAEIALTAAHNEIHIYTWGNSQCCLSRGTTSATLIDQWVAATGESAEEAPEYGEKYRGYEAKYPAEPVPPKPPARALKLQEGDFLLFEEVIGPKTGDPDDKDWKRRQVVRLTRVTAVEDPLVRVKVDGVPGDLPTPLVEIEWAPEDALPFPLCLSAIGPAQVAPPLKGCRLIEDITVARGNIFLVDHGQTVEQTPLDAVPAAVSEATCDGEGRPGEVTTTAVAIHPVLEKKPLVFAEPWRNEGPAHGRLAQDLRKAQPAVRLRATPGGAWWPQPDLLGSDGDAPHFVVEIDDAGAAHLRFGDGEAGMQPAAGTVFQPTYRIGGGVVGTVGAETITCVVTRGGLKLDGVTLRARNPLAAAGGAAAELMAEAKLLAPHAFRTVLQRAITAADYAAIAMREFPAEIQRAGAELRWMGSWYAARVAIDPRGTEEDSPALRKGIARRLHRYRRMGHDLQVVPARYVPLQIELSVCVLPHYLRGHVEAALLQVFSGRVRANGQPGFFHPDRLSFGESIYLSRLVAEAQAVEGVESVSVTRLEREFAGPNHELERGVLPIGPLEVARLDGDRNNPENGVLKLVPKGGR